MEVEAPVADGHHPPYNFIPNQGYEHSSNNAPLFYQGDSSSGQKTPVESDDDLLDDDDDNDDGEEREIDDVVLSTNDPNDYTKQYNRQRKFNDSSVPQSQKPKANPQKPKANVATMIDDQISSLAKHAGRLKLDNLEAATTKKAEKLTDRSDRATSEQVLDPRTRMILLKMINRNVVTQVNGCVSTGKEANVYHATFTPEETELSPTSKTVQRAIKVYKTSILVFKDREKYVAGEFRFRQGYNKSSNRAMVKIWAEKEMRNLKRLHAAGNPTPEAQ